MITAPPLADTHRSRSIPSSVLPSPLVVSPTGSYPCTGGSAFFNPTAPGSIPKQRTMEDQIGDPSKTVVKNGNNPYNALISPALSSSSGGRSLKSDTIAIKATEECPAPVPQAARLTPDIVASYSGSFDDQPRQSTELVIPERSSVSLDVLDRGRTSSPTP